MTNPHGEGESIRLSIRLHLILAGAFLFVLVFGLGGWASTTEIAGAVVAPGTLVVDSNVKKVQHPTGGVVGKLYVKEGDRVHAGDLLVRLDETQTRAALTIVTRELDELNARRTRLEAERDDADHLVFSPDLMARRGDRELERVLTGEQKLFEIRKTARAGQISQLRERVSQLQDEIRGADDQVASKEKEIELITQELAGVRELWSKKLVPISRVTALNRDAARLSGERGSLTATVAQFRGKISETELQILQIDQDLRSEVGKELAEIRAKSSEMVERRVTAEDQLKRVEVRAPQSGTVHQLAIHTVGGVIAPGEQILLVVPDADDLVVEARIAPQDVDKVRPGQAARLRFAAFDQRTTPEIKGEVSRVSADLMQDKLTGQSYYTIRLMTSKEELATLSGHKLVPGMPVEVFMKTGDRTILSYLVKPLADQAARAFRER
jgi:HlyD family secretion protein